MENTLSDHERYIKDRVKRFECLLDEALRYGGFPNISKVVKISKCQMAKCHEEAIYGEKPCILANQIENILSEAPFNIKNDRLNHEIRALLCLAERIDSFSIIEKNKL